MKRFFEVFLKGGIFEVFLKDSILEVFLKDGILEVFLKGGILREPTVPLNGRKVFPIQIRTHIFPNTILLFLFQQIF